MFRIEYKLILFSTISLASICSHLSCRSLQAQDELRQTATESLKQATRYFHEHVAAHGGYVYFYSLDLTQRFGEGIATPDQIWVQPPGTPTVGMALLKAYEATGDPVFLDAATDAATALIYGQLKSGGWTNCVDFDPKGERVSEYRNGKGKGKNNSSLDDGQTQSAIQFLVLADATHKFQHAQIHESAKVALDALLDAQFPNGAFPQIWTRPVQPQPQLMASYPDYDWRTEGRVKNYWDMYTLNDNVNGYLAETLITAYEVYQDKRYLDALKKLGGFLIEAQMPSPQPGWAQQYNYKMQPIWARKFEPPAVASDETQEAIFTLLRIHQLTRDEKYLAPIPAALAWLTKSRLREGQFARYYELKTNRPLYMTRDGDNYSLTYDDANLPDHYGWKIDSKIEKLERLYREVKRGEFNLTGEVPKAAEVTEIIDSLDDQGRWVSTYRGERLIGQAKLASGSKYLSSEVFSKNVTRLSDFLIEQKAK
jgi:PelA/Pel-15E family pectate lyase